MKQIFCTNCGAEIFEKDDFMHLEEYLIGELKKENWFHRKCWEDKSKIKKLAFALAGRASRIMDKAEDKMGGKEEYVIQ